MAQTAKVDTRKTPATSQDVSQTLRRLAKAARAGDATAAEDLRRLVAELRASAIVTPAKRPEELDPDWGDRVLAVIEGIRRGVPQEWTEEELERRIAQAIAEVRANCAGGR